VALDVRACGRFAAGHGSFTGASHRGLFSEHVPEATKIGRAQWAIRAQPRRTRPSRNWGTMRCQTQRSCPTRCATAVDGVHVPNRARSPVDDVTTKLGIFSFHGKLVGGRPACSGLDCWRETTRRVAQGALRAVRERKGGPYLVFRCPHEVACRLTNEEEVRCGVTGHGCNEGCRRFHVMAGAPSRCLPRPRKVAKFDAVRPR
jgi:hypothetical protein